LGLESRVNHTAVMSPSPTSPNVIAMVYVPATLLIVGTALVDLRFVPVAILVAGALGYWTMSDSGMHEECT